ncbi:MAG: TonB-dependent receptor, partial [Novosphingobium sp.]|nr:TonB-dependent receptor [Novosphingobium sp.]
GYSYLNTELRSVDVPTNPSPLYQPTDPARLPRVGSDLPLTPHHRITATATYTLPLDSSIGRVSLGATWVHTSSQLAGLLASPYNVMPASNLLNLNLNWNAVAGTPVDLAAFVTNATREVFPTAVSGNWGSGYESFLYTPPRMYGLRLRYRFGN